MNKLNDYFMNLLYNPDFVPGDFQTVGLNSGNTSIEDKEYYKDLDIVRNNPLLLTEGKFDEKKFDRLYEQSLYGYNILSQYGSSQRLATSYAAFRDDIFSNPANRNRGSETFITKIANPDRQLIGFVSNNIMENPTLSSREIAQKNFVWDPATNSWIDSPNDSTIMNFLDPKVMALYDEDVDINGKTSGQLGFDKSKIAHHKGEKKIDPLLGTYYYERLNGRSIYGREVLSGWDTLTRDDSWINKYDFFDSDGLDKNITGSIVKNVVKVAPAFIPGIAPWYIASRVLLNSMDLFAKIGKMTTGSDSPILSHLEGINSAFTFSTSDYSALRSFSIENILNLSADVFTQLAEQRWMFLYLPSILLGNKLGFSKEALEAFKLKEANKIREQFKGLLNASKLSPFEKAIDLSTSPVYYALAMLDSKMKSAYKFGHELSKLYMTGITVADSYGEAKELGLSDVEAALFTLGYAAAEYGLLSTNLGEHIFPELRAEKAKYKNIVKTLLNNKIDKKDTRKAYLKLIDLGKEAAIGDYNDAKIAAAFKVGSTTKAWTLAVASNALGEGLEEVSEEFLLDMSKLLYNAAANLGITLTGNTMEAFDGGNLDLILTRYSLNLLGGLIGGAVAVGLPSFLEGIKNMLGTNMDKKLAYQELVALIRNGKKEEFLRTVNKLEINDPNLSAVNYETVDGVTVYKPGTDEDNLDRASKLVLEGLVNLIDNLLSTNGVKMDDDSILSKLTKAKELARFLTILGNENEGSATLANYLLDFNTLAARIANVATLIEAIKHPAVDQKSVANEIREENLEKLLTLENTLLDLIKQRDAYINGDMAKIIIPKVIFEMSPIIAAPYITTNFKDYAEKVEHRIISEISDERLSELKKAWEGYKSSNFKDDIEWAFLNFMIVLRLFSDKLDNFFTNSLIAPQNLQISLGNLFYNTEQVITDPSNEPEDVQRNVQSYELTLGISKNPGILATMNALSLLAKSLGKEFEVIRTLQNIPEDISSITDPEALLELKDLGTTIGVDINTNEDARKVRDYYLKSFLNEILTDDRVKDILEEVPYYNMATRDFLIHRFFNRMLDNLDYEDLDNLEEIQKIVLKYNDYVRIINSKPITPIETLADEFLLSIGDNNMKISLLIETLQRVMTQKANTNLIDEFGYGVNVAELITNAESILELLASHVLASRYDSGKLGNIFGFNSTVNELNPDMHLAEIGKYAADTLMLDIAKLQSKLNYFKSIFNVNSGLKLVELKKIAVRLNVAVINKFRQIISIIPDDWNELDDDGKGVLDKVMLAFDKASVFKSIMSDDSDTKYSLSLDKMNELEKEAILVQDALYNLFNHPNNIDRIGKLDLSKLKLLPSTDGESTTYNNTLIDSLLEDIDDRTAVMLLATAASVKASDFYAEYKESLVEGIAPIPAQELAIKMAYSFLLNKPMFKRFGEAYNNKILEEILTANSSKMFSLYLKNVTQDSKLDNSYALQFENTFLVEGIAGAGKTKGFLRILYNMLLNFHEELLEEVWFIHTDESKAEAWAKEMRANPNTSHFYSKESYLKKIFPEYKKPRYTSTGVMIVNESELELDENTGISHYKGVEIALGIGTPSLILIDESTRFSQLEMLVSDKFQKEHNISAIATGDYDLLGAVGLTTLSNGNTLFINTTADNFFHCPKLGTSMRTDNKIKDLNNEEIRRNKLKVIRALISGDTPVPFLLSYYEGENGLYGEKIASKDDIDSTVTLMLNTLKGEYVNGVWEGEKLHVIYLDVNSEVVQKLKELESNNEAFKGKIDFIESSVAQGDEGQYYIMDLQTIDISTQNSNNLGNHLNFINTFYTGITRSSLGTLIIDNPNIHQIAITNLVKELTRSPLSEEAKRAFLEDRLKALSEIITSEPGNTVLVTDTTSTNIAEETELETTEEEATELNTRKVEISNSNNSNAYNMLLHTMPVNETGFVKDDNGNYVPSVGHEERIDGLNGIVKLETTEVTNSKGKKVKLTRFKNLGLKDGKLNNPTAALEALNHIVQAGLYLDDKLKIIEIVQLYLGLPLDSDLLGVNFVFMIRDTYDKESNVQAKKRSGFLRFLKSKTEALMGVFRGNNSPNNIERAGQNKYFAMNVYRIDENGREVNFLTVPLAIFTNPLTMLHTKGFEDLKNTYLSFPKDSRDVEMRNYLLSSTLPNHKKFLKHLLIYNYKNINPATGKPLDAIVYLDGTLRDFILSSSGPSIIVTDKGAHNLNLTYDYPYYDGEYVNLTDIDLTVHHLTKRIYYVADDVVVNGKTIIKKGRGFVLASDYYKTVSDSDLFQLFVQHELNSNPLGRISVIYVSSPKISITDYFKNFALKFKSGNIDSNIGNELTDFRISEAITKTDSPYDKYIKELVDSNPNNKTATLARWEIFKNIILTISSDFEKLDSKLRINLLNTPISLTSYINLIKYEGSDDNIKRAIDSLKGTYSSKDITVKNFISNTLLVMVLKLRNGFINPKLLWTSEGLLDVDDIITENLTKVTESLPLRFQEGVYTRIKRVGDSIDISEYSFIPASDENYLNMLENKNYGVFRINGKIDSTTMTADVSPLMDIILATLLDENKKGMLRDWYAKDTKKHVVTNPVLPKTIELLIPESILDRISNKSEFVNVILNNVKEFESGSNNDILSLLYKLQNVGYTLIEDLNNWNIVKLPNEFRRDVNLRNIIYNSTDMYILNTDGSYSKPTEEYLNSLYLSPSEKSSIESATDEDTLISERSKSLYRLYKQIQAQFKGSENLITLEDLLDSITGDIENEIESLYGDIELFKVDVKYYIKQYNEEHINMSFVEYFEDIYRIRPTRPSLQFLTFIQNVEELAKIYDNKNNCP